ncbi:MAG: DUF4832 domain-containing protein [Bacillota bacterium]|nr:DUF4832 domain-containing protein [Bacillota bacterium]
MTIFTKKNIPVESNKVLDNPLMGFAPDGRWIVTGQPYKLVFACITWKDIEPIKGQYDFSSIEKKYNLNYWHEHNVKIILRLVLDYPSTGKHKDIPDWLYEEINRNGTWYDNKYGKGFSPNYENPILLSYHEKLISTLGRKYNKSGDIAFVEIGSLGHWGELHTMQASEYTFIPFPKESIVNQYVKHYINSFPDKLLMMRRPFNISKVSNIGIFNDVMGNNYETYQLLSWVNLGYFNEYTKTEQAAMPEFWKTSPSGGEFAEGNAGVQYFTSSKINDTIHQAIKSHISWIGPNCPAKISDTALQENFNKFLKTIGYRFVLSEVSAPSTTNSNKAVLVTITVKNIGIAPFYYKWPVSIYLLYLDGKIISKTTLTEDIRNWLPGSHTFSTKISIPSAIKPGNYMLAISIDDPSTERPAVDFANYGRFPEGYFYLISIRVKK